MALFHKANTVCYQIVPAEYKKSVVLLLSIGLEYVDGNTVLGKSLLRVNN